MVMEDSLVLVVYLYVLLVKIYMCTDIRCRI